MAKKINNIETPLKVTIVDEEWKGNIEGVVIIEENNQKIKLSLSKFKQAYGEYMLNK
jgi:hypothetical protein